MLCSALRPGILAALLRQYRSPPPVAPADPLGQRGRRTLWVRKVPLLGTLRHLVPWNRTKKDSLSHHHFCLLDSHFPMEGHLDRLYLLERPSGWYGLIGSDTNAPQGAFQGRIYTDSADSAGFSPVCKRRRWVG